MGKDTPIMKKHQIMSKISEWIDEKVGQLDELTITLKSKDVDKEVQSMQFKILFKGDE